MNNSTLKTLLIEYDKKRRNAEEIAQKEKEKIYKEFPELTVIDKQLSTLALSSMKELVKNNDKKILEKLNSDIANLKDKKQKILSSVGEKIYPIYLFNINAIIAKIRGMFSTIHKQLCVIV